ncbi:MAG: SgcJ/EcaC family oxidoreductase [Planctomycetaceae bacterium]|nr:SgcJ/EcaC family oxidoreductase [Planctomycetaceae bacterium]
MSRISSCGGVWLVLLVASVVVGQSSGNDSNEQAIRSSANAFRTAFNQGDAKALANLWVPSGENIDQTGQVQRGREAIAAAFAKLFSEHSGATIDISIESIRFPQPDVALEMGTTTTNLPGRDEAVGGHYTATHVKHQGEWLLYRVHEGPPLPPSNFKHLKNLDWLLGRWIDDLPLTGKKDQKPIPIVHTSCRWSINHNFLIREFTATVNGKVTNTGTQWIGWYAPAKQIRSWTFNSQGGIVTGLWSKEDGKWTVKTREALRGGQVVTSLEVISIAENGVQTWQTTDRKVGDKQLRDLVVKVKPYQQF